MSIIFQVGALRSLSGAGADRPLSVNPSSFDDHEMSLPPSREICRRPVHTYPGCFGLPYQDHNYGAPPPITPPPSPPAMKINGHIDVLEDVPRPTLIAKEEIVDDSITRCICEYQHDDGYMICCDSCSVWQHIDCMGIDRNNIPDSYFCERCQIRPVDVERARSIQTRKKEELANLDTSATDTDPEELANRLAALDKKSPITKKVTKQRRNSKLKDKIGSKQKSLKEKKGLKKEKENLKLGNLKVKFKNVKECPQKSAKPKNRRNSHTVCKVNGEAWKCDGFDRFEDAKENQYSKDVQAIFSRYNVNGINLDDFHSDGERLLDQLWCLGQIKKQVMIIEAKEPILPGLAVLEYKGIVLLRQHYVDTNLFFKIAHPHVLFYSKFEDIDLCIDSSSYGNKARYIRRSCSPNAEVRHLVEHGRIHFVIFSNKEIEKGEEITIPFDYNYQECMYCVECACLRNNCTVSKFWKKITKNTQNKTVKKQRLQRPSIEANITVKTELSPLKSEILKIKESIPQSPVKAVKKTLQITPVKQEPKPVPEKPATPVSPIKIKHEPVTVKVQSASEPPKVKPDSGPVKVKSDSTPVKVRCDSGPTRVKHEMVSTRVRHESGPAKVKHELSSTRIKQQESIRVRHESGSDSSISPLSTPEKLEQDEADHKLTREERKMNAIMKAFEKLEKREERRKEALARIDVHRKSQDEPKKIVETKVTSEDDSKTGSEEVSDAKEEQIKPEAPLRVQRKGRKRPLRRRSRVNSTSAAEVIISPDESSSNIMTCSTPNTPIPVSADITSVNTAGFKFLKTKKHLFNEWLTEKGNDGKPTVSAPLEIKVDETIFVPCLPSPRNAMDHIQRRNSQSSGSGKFGAESSRGSAKKRWLRQAMHEVPTSCDSGSMSPVHGCTSPNPGICSPPVSTSIIGSPIPGVSPSSSPPVDFVTPLKKRRLARESLSQEVPILSTPSTPSTVVQSNPLEGLLFTSRDDQLPSSNSKCYKSDSTDLESEVENTVLPCPNDANNLNESAENSRISDNFSSDSNSALNVTADSGVVTDTQCEQFVENMEVDSKTTETKKLSEILLISDNDTDSIDNKTSNENTDVQNINMKEINKERDSNEKSESVSEQIQKEQTVSTCIVDSSQDEPMIANSCESSSQSLKSEKLCEEIESSATDQVCTSNTTDKNISEETEDNIASSEIPTSSAILTVSYEQCVNTAVESSDFSTDTEASAVVNENGFTCKSNNLEKVESFGFLPSSTEKCADSTQSSNLMPSKDWSHCDSTSGDHVSSSFTSDNLVSSTNSSDFCSNQVLSSFIRPPSPHNLSHTSIEVGTVCADISVECAVLPQTSIALSISPSITDQSQPCKKKVSLFEYRKRLKSKGKETNVNQASSISKNIHDIPARVTGSNSLPNLRGRQPTLPSLPLFVEKKSKKNEAKEKKSWHGLSLTERLRQEFGVEASEEDEKFDNSREGSLTPPPPPPPPPVQKSPSPRLMKFKDGDEKTIIPSSVPPPPLAPHPGHTHSAPPPPPPPPKGVANRIPSLMSIPTFANRGLAVGVVQPASNMVTGNSVLPLQSPPTLVTSSPLIVNYQAHNGSTVNSQTSSPQAVPYHQPITPSYPTSQDTSPAYSGSTGHYSNRYRRNSSPSQSHQTGREVPLTHSYNHTSDSISRSQWSNGRRTSYSSKFH